MMFVYDVTWLISRYGCHKISEISEFNSRNNLKDVSDNKTEDILRAADFKTSYNFCMHVLDRITIPQYRKSHKYPTWCS